MNGDAEPPGLIHPPNRLARILAAEDAVPISVLVQGAEAQVEAMTPVFAASLAPQVAALVALCRQGDPDLQAEARDIRRAALAVVETAAITRRHDIVPVALGICDLLDRWLFASEWAPRLVRALAEGLHALVFAPGLTQADQGRLIDDLMQIRAESDAASPPSLTRVA